MHSSCLAYASAIRFKVSQLNHVDANNFLAPFGLVLKRLDATQGSEGGGPCTTCGCYCAAHIHLGHYPTRCSCGGCPCAEFRPENGAILTTTFRRISRSFWPLFVAHFRPS